MNYVRSVLVVDDDPADLELATIQLKRTGLYKHILVARDGTEALDLYRRYEEQGSVDPEKFPPLIILLDINMPLMSGFELLDALKQQGIEQPADTIIILTSSQSAKDIQRAEDFAKVAEYIVKPLSSREALRLVECYGEPSPS